LPRVKKHQPSKFKGEVAPPQQAFSSRPYALSRELKVAMARAASQPELIAVSSNLPPNAAQIWESEIK
jgi:hypothetical protein